MSDQAKSICNLGLNVTIPSVCVYSGGWVRAQSLHSQPWQPWLLYNKILVTETGPVAAMPGWQGGCLSSGINKLYISLTLTDIAINLHASLQWLGRNTIGRCFLLDIIVCPGPWHHGWYTNLERSITNSDMYKSYTEQGSYVFCCLLWTSSKGELLHIHASESQNMYITAKLKKLICIF